MTSLHMNQRTIWLRGLTVLWLALICAIAIHRLHKFFPGLTDELNSDAMHTYLPGARLILERGLDFLIHDARSYHVAPLGYLWPALWQADVATIRLANCGLFLASVLLMWGAAKRLGGPVAGVIATLLLVYHPGIVYYMPKVLTEPIFLFGLTLFLYASIEVAFRPQRNTGFFVAAGMGLLITLLSRPALQLLVLGTIPLMALILALRKMPAWHSRLKKSLITLIAVCLLPAVVVIKNGVQFDVWGIGTGTGAGLHYGLNPLRLGIEPVFMGFEYDIGQLVAVAEPSTGGQPLTRLSDQIERQTALSLLRHTDLTDAVRFFGEKVYSWLFYSSVELVIDSSLRKFRLFELLCIAAACLVLLRSIRSRQPHMLALVLGSVDAKDKLYAAHSRTRLLLFILLLITAVAMLGQLTPLLYNTRYNAGFLEPWLILLSSMSFALITRDVRLQTLGDGLSKLRAGEYRAALRSPLWRQLLLIALIVLVVFQATSWAKRHEVTRLDPYRLGPTTEVLDARYFGEPHAEGMETLDQRRWRITSRPARLEIPISTPAGQTFPPQNYMDGVWRMRFAVDAKDSKSCRIAGLHISHPLPTSAWPVPELRITADGKMRTYAIHGNHNLRPATPGTLTVTLNCAPGTVMEWQGAELLRSTLAEAARELRHSGTPINPYRRSEPQ